MKYKLHIPVVNNNKLLTIQTYNKSQHHKTNTRLYKEDYFEYTQPIYNKDIVPLVKNVKRKVIKDYHDLVIDKQMNVLKVEIENKYKRSNVNMSYKFPRKQNDGSVRSCQFSESAIVSIYETVNDLHGVDEVKGRTIRKMQSPNPVRKMKRQFLEILRTRKEESKKAFYETKKLHHRSQHSYSNQKHKDLHRHLKQNINSEALLTINTEQNLSAMKGRTKKENVIEYLYVLKLNNKRPG